jgi:hypothetical protein
MYGMLPRVISMSWLIGACFNLHIMSTIYIEVSSCRVHDMLLDLIVRRCKEDNFLHLVNEPEAVAEVQDEIIRQLTVVGFTDIEDDRVPITLGQNLHKFVPFHTWKIQLDTYAA